MLFYHQQAPDPPRLRRSHPLVSAATDLLPLLLPLLLLILPAQFPRSLSTSTAPALQFSTSHCRTSVWFLAPAQEITLLPPRPQSTAPRCPVHWLCSSRGAWSSSNPCPRCLSTSLSLLILWPCSVYHRYGSITVTRWFVTLNFYTWIVCYEYFSCKNYRL